MMEVQRLWHFTNSVGPCCCLGVFKTKYDYTAQIFKARHCFILQSLEQIYQMLKSWYDVVVRCGEDPRQLLAAALVNVGNNLLASELIPDWQLKGINQ